MTEPTTETTPEGTEQPAQAAEVDWKAEARKWETRAKENHQKLKEAEPIVSQWRQLEEASKSELERAREELTRWQTEASTWRTAAVSSRVERLAADAFADPSDALAAIPDPGKYLGAGGEIDEAAIKADLDALLERKPHWRRSAEQAAPTTRVPAPNYAQGAGGGKSAADPASELASILRSQLGT